MNKQSPIYVAGHTGLIGTALVKKLREAGYTNLLLRTRGQLDLLEQPGVFAFFKKENPEYVIDCAARVGGIQANSTSPADFLYENLQIQNNLIWGAKEAGVKKFIFISSAVTYSTDCSQPMREEDLGVGKLDTGNEGYALAKITGMKLCDFIRKQYNLDFITCVPTNLYGPGSSFDPSNAHVIPSLIRRMYEAKVSNAENISVWGSGNSRRDFLYSEDFVDAILWMLAEYNDADTVNIATGEDVSIRTVAETIQKIVGYEGEIVFDTTKPEGVPKRLLDVSRVNKAGWSSHTSLEKGIKQTYQWFLKNHVK